MGDRMRAFDWDKTVIGPIGELRPTLKTLIPPMLANRFPHLLWWGPDYVTEKAACSSPCCRARTG